MNLSLLAGAVLNGMVTGMLYALMGVGLSLILGLLNIPNFAHGVLYALGAYVMISGAKAFGFLGGLLAAIVAVAMLGAAIEYFGVRRLYRVHPDYILLLSFGLSLILTETIILVWGPVGITFQPPPLLMGAVDLGVPAYPKYRLVVMAFTAMLVLGCHLFVTRTRYGAILRAGIEDKDMAAVLGINIRRVFTLTFAAGTGLAGLGGGLMTPGGGLLPPAGIDILPLAFVFVVLGGGGGPPGGVPAGPAVGGGPPRVTAPWGPAG